MTPTFTADEWTTKARSHLQRYRWQVGDAKAAVEAAKKLHPGNAAYQPYLTATPGHCPTTAFHANALNATLTYLDPWPAVLPHRTVQTVVAVRGNYRKMHWFLNRGKTYAWKHAIHLSTWQSLVFPESTRCAAPFLRDY